MTITSIAAPPRRLLAGTAFGTNDLSAHTELHGPLPPVRTGDLGWSTWLAGTIEQAGVTGRGGAGFPAYRKQRLVAALDRQSVLVVNAMEGEPASVKDQVLLERSPHLVLDGAELVATMLGSERVVLCLPDSADRDHTAQVLRGAIAERLAARPGVTRPTEVLRPPARYVGGEESALVSFVAGHDGLPSFRPDKSVPLFIGRRVALVHNAETLAHIALIARRGPDWFRRLGTPEAPGTTLVTVSGEVGRPGVHEVEIGVPIREILEGCGATAGTPGVLVGGYGGSWLNTERLDIPYAPRSLADVGVAIGVGILAVLPARSCGIAETARIAGYMAGESAGQCGPCVFGLPAIAAELDTLAHSAVGARNDKCLRRIEGLCRTVSGRGACRHPDGVIRLVRSALSVFAADAVAHAAGCRCASHDAPTIFPFPAR